MPSSSRAQVQFNAGELAPELYGRADLDQFRQGVRRLENFIPLRTGPARRRPGTRFIASLRGEDHAPRLLPFQFSVEQAYVLEFGWASGISGYIRFFAEQGQVLDERISNGTFESNITGWDNLSSGGGAIAHDAANKRLSLSGGGGTAHAEQDVAISNTAEEHVLRLTIFDGAVTVTIGTSSGGTQVMGATVLQPGDHALPFTPGAATVYVGFKFTGTGTRQVDDVSLSWAYQISHPYSAAELAELQFAQQEDVLFLAHPNHKPRQLTRSGHTSWTLASYAPTADPFTGAGDYPAAVTLFAERIVWGGTGNAPNRIFASLSGDVNDMTTGADDNDGFAATLAGPQNNVIRWLVGADDLIVGTAGAEWSTLRNAAFTPAARAIRQRAQNGVARLQPVAVGNRIVYPRRFGDPVNRGRVLGALAYEFESDGLVPLELSTAARHIGAAGFADMAWQQEPDRILWAVRADGVLVSLTWDPGEAVLGWARHPMTNGAVEAIAVIPGAERDEVWLAIRRDIDGQPRRYVELMDPDLHCDAALSGEALTPTLTWSGLDHLEGETVAVVADGAPVGDLVVVDGAVTLGAAALTVAAGHPYVSALEPNDAAEGAADGSAMGRDKSAWRITLLLDATVGIRVDGREVIFREVEDSVGAAIPAFSGYKTAQAEGWSTTGRFTITQDVPAPCTLLALIVQQEVNEA